MDLEKLFSVCNVEVTCEEDVDLPDIYAAAEAEGGRLKLNAMRHDLHRVPLEIGARVSLRSILPDAAYVMSGRVVSCLVGNSVTVVVEQDGEIERIQRRRFFRVQIALPVRIETSAADVPPLNDLVTEDASAGGLRIVSPRELTVGIAVRIFLDPGDDGPEIECRGEVIRSMPGDSRGKRLCVKFLDLAEQDKERLISVLTQEVRRQRNL